MNKEKYEQPMIEIIEFEAEGIRTDDIIMISGDMDEIEWFLLSPEELF